MQLEALTIRAFRNLTPVALAFGPGVHLFYGANGQGKTNLLEAACLVVNGTSPRTSSLAETIPWEGERSELGGCQEAFGVRYRVDLSIAPKSKSLQVDGSARRSLPGIAKGCLALTFLPEDLVILTGEPSLRRDFLDRTLTLWDTAHAADLRAYSGALVARTRVLRDLAATGQPLGARGIALLQPYEQILLQRGQAIVQRRATLVRDLATQMQLTAETFDIPLQITGTYLPHVPELLGEGEAALRAAEQRLMERRQVDLIQKRTTVGPHRDDLQVDCKGAGVRHFASRGETRLAMVLLLIAKLQVVMDRLQFTPLIILDDIFSELDRERRRLVVQALPREAQVLCSAVEQDLEAAWLGEREAVTSWQVQRGVITPQGGQ